MKNINIRIKHILSTLIIIVLAVSLVGCSGKVYLTTGLSNDQLLKVSGNVVPMSLGKLVLATEEYNYSSTLEKNLWGMEYEGETLESNLKNTVKQQLAELMTISMLAKDKKIVLSNSEKEKLEAAAKAFYEELTKEEIQALGITNQDIYNLYEMFMISEKLYTLITDSTEIEISDEDARVINVQYCFVSTYYVDANNEKIEMSNDGKQAAKYKINEAYNLVQSGTDFALVAKEYSDDSVYEYEFGRGEMEADFEKAAFALSDGETSEIIYGDNGFYITKCIESYDEVKTQENKKILLKKYKNQAFLDVYEPFMKNQTYEYNDKTFNNIDINELVPDNNKLYEIYSQYVEE